MNWDECWVVKNTHTTAGYGLFARQKIHQGQPIFRVCPQVDIDLFMNTIYTVNHSCIPNMFALEGVDPWSKLQEVRFYAIRDIDVGEELTRCYEDKVLLEENVVMRRAWMRTFWGFDCQCVKCIGEWPNKYWHCPSHWIIDYRQTDRMLAEYLNGLVKSWKAEKSRLQARDKARIAAERTIFSLRSFRDQVKAAAGQVKRHTLDTRYKIKIESKTLHAYIWNWYYKKLLEG